MTFTLPENVARRLHAVYPKKKHSQIVAELLAKKLRMGDQQLARACRSANGLKRVERDMEDWEKLNGCDR